MSNIKSYDDIFIVNYLNQIKDYNLRFIIT